MSVRVGPVLGPWDDRVRPGSANLVDRRARPSPEERNELIEWSVRVLGDALWRGTHDREWQGALEGGNFGFKKYMSSDREVAEGYAFGYHNSRARKQSQGNFLMKLSVKKLLIHGYFEPAHSGDHIPSGIERVPKSVVDALQKEGIPVQYPLDENQASAVLMNFHDEHFGSESTAVARCVATLEIAWLPWKETTAEEWAECVTEIAEYMLTS